MIWPSDVSNVKRYRPGRVALDDDFRLAQLGPPLCAKHIRAAFRRDGCRPLSFGSAKAVCAATVLRDR